MGRQTTEAQLRAKKMPTANHRETTDDQAHGEAKRRALDRLDREWLVPMLMRHPQYRALFGKPVFDGVPGRAWARCISFSSNHWRDGLDIAVMWLAAVGWTRFIDGFGIGLAVIGAACAVILFLAWAHYLERRLLW